MSAGLKRRQPPARMTVAEFLEWPEDPAGALWQLVDGEPPMMAPASDVHNTLLSNINVVLGNHLAQRRPECRTVVTAGIQPRVRRDHNVRIPDLAVTCVPARPGVHLTPEPLLVVEILSITNQAETWSNVWTYCTIPSLQEILVIHTAEMAGEVLRRQPDRLWPERFTRQEEAIRLDSVGATLEMSAIYRHIATGEF